MFDEFVSLTTGTSTPIIIKDDRKKVVGCVLKSDKNKKKPKKHLCYYEAETIDSLESSKRYEMGSSVAYAAAVRVEIATDTRIADNGCKVT